jgi:hypothetical protein
MTTFTDTQRQAAQLARQRLNAERLAKAHHGAGWTIYPDTAPGVGWVLAVVGRSKRYYATEGEAEADICRLL